MFPTVSPRVGSASMCGGSMSLSGLSWDLATTGITVDFWVYVTARTLDAGVWLTADSSTSFNIVPYHTDGWNAMEFYSWMKWLSLSVKPWRC